MNEREEDRFRSFAERYVVARADRFDDTEPRKDAWKAVNDARNIYDQIHSVARQHYRSDQAQSSAAPNVPRDMQTMLPPYPVDHGHYNHEGHRLLDPAPPKITDHIHTSEWATRVKRAFGGKDPI